MWCVYVCACACFSWFPSFLLRQNIAKAHVVSSLACGAISNRLYIIITFPPLDPLQEDRPLPLPPVHAMRHKKPPSNDARLFSETQAPPPYKPSSGMDSGPSSRHFSVESSPTLPVRLQYDPSRSNDVPPMRQTPVKVVGKVKLHLAFTIYSTLASNCVCVCVLCVCCVCCVCVCVLCVCCCMLCVCCVCVLCVCLSAHRERLMRWSSCWSSMGCSTLRICCSRMDLIRSNSCVT